MWTTEKGNLGLFSDGLGKIIPSWVNSAAALSASGHCHCAATSDMSVPQRKDELVAHLGMRTALISCLGETLGVPAYDSNATGGDVGLLQKGMSVHTEVVHARGMKQRSFLDSGRLGFRYAVAGGDDRAGVSWSAPSLLVHLRRHNTFPDKAATRMRRSCFTACVSF
jgi:hypothetical protein